MIDEPRHDLAIEYVFGNIEGDARQEFEAWLQSDAELRALVDELTETAGALALAVPQHQPSAALRQRVLAITRGESPAPAPPSARQTGWIPWALAAGLAIACTLAASDRARWRSEARQVQSALRSAQADRDQAKKLAGQVRLVELQAKTHLDQIAELRDAVVKLRARDTLAQVKIATLTAQVAEFAKAGVILVWDAQEQRGVIQLANLPKPATGKDYQLWVIDPKYPAPVSAGVLLMADAGPTRVSFQADQLIERAEKFAISLEPAGGVASVAGPIIFAGE